MARPIRVEFAGAVYHVTARGNERRATFRDVVDRQLFLTTLEQAVREHGLRVHAFCLMPNHYHLLLETPRGNLSRAVGWLQTTYTIRFNHRHRRSGHLFQGRFKAHLVEADSYAMELLRYVHLNPVRPRDKSAPVPAERRKVLREYPWSSHRIYAGKVAAPDWLCTDWLSFFDRRREKAQRRYARFIDDAFDVALESPWQRLQGGLALGSESFLDRIRGLLEGRGGREEMRWVSEIESPAARQAAVTALAEKQKRRSVQIWVRVILGGERRSAVARSYGYQDASAITQSLKRLERAALEDRLLQKQINTLRAECETFLSSVKS
jgi:REP element-mobilizing transposase RayT